MASTPDLVRIRYLRPPAREETFVQRVLHRAPDCVVTFLQESTLSRPLVHDGRILLDPGAPAVWFTFPGARHDIGRFHRADGTFTGLYANILTPVEGIEGAEWRATDLFLDVWLAPDAPPVLLDVDELDEAERLGAVTAAQAGEARTEAGRLLADAAAGRWPPPVVHTWPLRRALEHIAERS